MDASLEGEVRFSVIYYDLEHVGNTVNVINPRGNLINSLNLMEEDGNVNMLFVTIKDVEVRFFC